jgi:hypothetical protein
MTQAMKKPDGLFTLFLKKFAKDCGNKSQKMQQQANKRN